MKIAIDAMGGDHAPQSQVKGAVMAAREGMSVILVGDCEILERELAKHDARGLPITLKHASQAVGMDENPIRAFRKKKDSSIKVCFELARSGEADAVVSAGNSGAAMTAGVLVLKRLPGVDRPAIAVTYPTLKKDVIMLDVGGNVDCKPIHMVQFALMGEVYAKYLLKKDRARIGLLSNAEEEGKGNELTRLTHELLSQSSLNYVGYVEGRDIFTGDLDVVVTDGFVGNIALKISEGILDAFMQMLKKEVSSSFLAKVGMVFARGAFRHMKRKIDPATYGGAPLLGVDGNCIISHGASTPMAIKNAVFLASRLVEGKVNLHLTEELERNQDLERLAKQAEVQ